MIKIQKSISKAWINERVLNDEDFKFIRLFALRPTQGLYWCVFDSFYFTNSERYRKANLNELRLRIQNENNYNFNASVVGDDYKETYFVFVIPEKYQTKEVLKDLENFLHGFDNIIFTCEVVDV